MSEQGARKGRKAEEARRWFEYYRLNKNWFSNRMDWRLIRAFGNSRIVKTSYVWLFVVPMAARALATIPDSLTFSVFGAEIPINVGLPFRWKLFYFMALAFATAQFLYWLNCPSMIRRYRDFKEYRERKAGTLHLTGRFHKMQCAIDKGNWKAQFVWENYAATARSLKDAPGIDERLRLATRLDEFLRMKNDPKIDLSDLEVGANYVSYMAQDERALHDLFECVQKYEATRAPVAFWIVASLFTVGVGFFVLIAWQSCWAVIRVL